MQSKRLLVKFSQYLWVKHPLYPYGTKEGLIAKFELNFSKKVILCMYIRDTAAKQKVFRLVF